MASRSKADGENNAEKIMCTNLNLLGKLIQFEYLQLYNICEII